MRSLAMATAFGLLLVAACVGSGNDYGDPEDPRDDSRADYTYAMSKFLGAGLDLKLDSAERECIADSILDEISDDAIRNVGLTADFFEDDPLAFAEVGQALDPAAAKRVKAAFAACAGGRCPSTNTEYGAALATLLFSPRTVDNAQEMFDDAKHLQPSCD